MKGRCLNIHKKRRTGWLSWMWCPGNSTKPGEFHRSKKQLWTEGALRVTPSLSNTCAFQTLLLNPCLSIVSIFRWWNCRRFYFALECFFCFFLSILYRLTSISFLIYLVFPYRCTRCTRLWCRLERTASLFFLDKHFFKKKPFRPYFSPLLWPSTFFLDFRSHVRKIWLAKIRDWFWKITENSI